MEDTDRSDEQRDDAGKYATKYQPAEFMDALRGLGGSGSTKEVADGVGCSRRTAHYRLTDLEDDGQITSREVGRSILWRVVKNGG
jgi:uncharacterized membrane protein